MTHAMRNGCGWHCILVVVAVASAIFGFYTGLYAGSIDNDGRHVRLELGFVSSPSKDVLLEHTEVQREHGEDRTNVTAKGKMEEMPHVEQCGLCFLCHKEKQPLSESVDMNLNMTEIMGRMQKPSEWKMNPVDEAFFKAGLMDDRSHMPKCTECYGCDHIFHPSVESTMTMLNKTYSMESGASPVWVLTAEELGVAQPQPDIVKVWCVPVLKPKQGGFAPCVEKSMETIRNIAAVQKISEDCGFEDVVPNSWKAPVNGVIDGVGYHINWDGMWFDHAKGVSVELFLRNNPPKASIEVLRKANSTQVIKIALFDLLTSQCDRHSQNIFIDENGQLTLIDNDQSLASRRYQCGVDSMFLPTTEEYAIHQVGFGYLTKSENSTPRKQPAIQTVLDYRCHAPGGKIGKNYPPRVQRCMENISSMTIEEIARSYYFQDYHQAEALQSRSKAMLERGFEWALEFSEPQKPSDRAYQWYKPCCEFDDHHQCLDKGWHTDARLPLF